MIRKRSREALPFRPPAANFNYKNVKINLIDTPGFLGFVGEVLTGLRVAGSAVITVDAESGIQVGARS